MNTIGLLHSVLAMSAIISGAAMLLRQKGTRSHRRIGWVYVASMVGLNVTALGIYRLSGNFGPFHAAAIVSLASHCWSSRCAAETTTPTGCASTTSG